MERARRTRMAGEIVALRTNGDVTREIFVPLD